MVVQALYGLKFSGVAFWSFFAETLNSLNYRPYYSDPDVRMRPAVKPDGYQYCEYVVCYVNDILCISHKPEETMKGIQSYFNLKNNKVEEPTY